VSPDAVLQELTLDIKELQRNIRTIEHDLVAFEDIKNLKLMLKSVRLVPAAPAFDLMPF